MMLAVAENEAEVRSLLERDIYGTSGVWDLEKAQIIPVCLPFCCFYGGDCGSGADIGFSLSLLCVSSCEVVGIE